MGLLLANPVKLPDKSGCLDVPEKNLDFFLHCGPTHMISTYYTCIFDILEQIKGRGGWLILNKCTEIFMVFNVLLVEHSNPLPIFFLNKRWVFFLVADTY